jgi:small nuclear ribonucleoprotein
MNGKNSGMTIGQLLGNDTFKYSPSNRPSGDQAMKKPLNVLNQSINNPVIVELKGKREYRGVLDGYDPHMNLVLKNAEELVAGETVRKHPIAIVRGDNVIYISP